MGDVIACPYSGTCKLTFPVELEPLLAEPVPRGDMSTRVM